MATSAIKDIELTNLLLNLDNPRHPRQATQRGALIRIAQDQQIKLVNLGEDILSKGTDPSTLVMVAANADPSFYDVLEGNRRVAALKLILSPEILEGSRVKKTVHERFKQLNRDNASSVPSATCKSERTYMR